MASLNKLFDTCKNFWSVFFLQKLFANFSASMPIAHCTHCLGITFNLSIKCNETISFRESFKYTGRLNFILFCCTPCTSCTVLLYFLYSITLLPICMKGHSPFTNIVLNTKSQICDKTDKRKCEVGQNK